MKRKRRVHNGMFKRGNDFHRSLSRDDHGRFIGRDNVVVDVKKIEEEVDEFLKKREWKEK